MGYRSDVKILCEPKAYQMIKDSMDEYNKTQDLYKFKPHEIQQKDNFTLLSWYDVKWYYDYEDVQSVESVLDKLRDEYSDTEGYGFKKIEVGEDGETVEMANNYELDSYLFVMHIIECNW
jgi:hypothetical protein